MGVEVVGSGIAHVSVETGKDEKITLLHDKDDGKVNQSSEPIKFGSYTTDEPDKGEVNNVATANFPKDAVDEWPATQQVHNFYVLKYRSYDDPKLKAKLEQADTDLQKKNQARTQITEKLRAKRAERAQVIAQLRSLGDENKQFRSVMDEKRKEMEPLQQALGKLRGSNNAGRERGAGICSSEEELNELIKSLQYRIQHESIPLSEEKQILREIKQLEGTREKVIANAAMRAQIQDSMGEKEAIQDQVKLIGVDLDGVRKERQVIKAKIKQLEEEKAAIEKVINALQEELTMVTEKRNRAFETIQELRKQREEGNALFYQYRATLNKAKDLAAKKDVEALKAFIDMEVDKFMSLYNSGKAVRDDYEKRVLPSLDNRQFSRDGRMRNPDEKPLLPKEPTPSGTETLPKASKPKEVSVPLPLNDTSSNKVQREEKNSKQQKEAKKKVAESNVEPSAIVDSEEIAGIEKPKSDRPLENEVDEAKLKEMKREEEMAKARLALERKKKLAEKAAAKAVVKAQKEAEKKLKEREKRARKKAGSSVAAPETEEPAAVAADAAEPERVIEEVTVPVPATKNKERKENAVRYRGRAKGADSLQKILIKRKKSTNYWVWAGSAVLLVLLLVALGYNYLLRA